MQLGCSLLAILLILMILGSFFESSGVFTVAFGCGYWFRIHSFLYYAVVLILCGVFQSTGWPVVVVMGNWFGKSKRGLIMGGLDLSLFCWEYYGFDFFWPGLFVLFIGMVVYLFLVVSPKLVHFFFQVKLSLIRLRVLILGKLYIVQFKDSKSLQTSYMEEIKFLVAVGFIESWKLSTISSFAICPFFPSLWPLHCSIGCHSIYDTQVMIMHLLLE